MILFIRAFEMYRTQTMLDNYHDDINIQIQITTIYLFSDFNATCIDLNISDNCMLLTGYMALYKVIIGHQLYKIYFSASQAFHVWHSTRSSFSVFSFSFQYHGFSVFNFSFQYHGFLHHNNIFSIVAVVKSEHIKIIML